MNLKIGLLLGSFDPIHYGHIAMASVVLNSGLCDKVLFVVAKQNPWKKHKAANFELRCEMVKASIYPFLGACEVCTLEKNIDSTAYSYKVLELIKKEYPNDELFLIAGTDTIDIIPHWRNFNDKIKPYFKFIEIGRGDKYKAELKNEETFVITKTSREGMGEFNCIIPRITDVSSTAIREMVKNNMNPYPYVTQEVSNIIFKNKLYT